MAGVRSKPLPSGKFHAWFTDCRGKFKFFVGTRNKNLTLRMAQRFEDEHRQIRLGYRPLPKPYQKHAVQDIAEIIRQYLEWGRAQGGRNGMPWGEVHVRNRIAQLEWWKKRLKLKILADLNGILPHVEKLLREFSASGHSGKTCQNYVETLRSFCRWCVKRDFISDDPLKMITHFDIAPRVIRRAMTPEEIQKLLEVAAPHRGLLYEAAMCTGLRANELKSLTLSDIDLQNSGLNLKREWTKNRKSGFQPLPASLVKKLYEFSIAGTPADLYDRHFCRHDSSCDAPPNALLFVPTKLSRELDKDLVRAGIPKLTEKGKIDFHSFRVVFVTYLFEVGANVKEAQTLARHATPDLTVNVYARTRDTRLTEIVQQVQDRIIPEKNIALLLHFPKSPENPKVVSHLRVINCD